MVSGKYKKRLNTVFLLVFTLLIIGFMSIFVKLIFIQEANQYEATVVQAFRSILSSSQIKLEVINNTLETVIESDEALDWSNSNTSAMFYRNASRMQKMIRKVNSKVKNVNFQISATFFDKDSLVITPVSSEPKEYFFNKNLMITQEQVEEIYRHFENNSKYMVFTTKDVNGSQQICYITKKQYTKRTLLYFVTIPYASFIDKNMEYDWYLGNEKGVFAMKENAKIPSADIYQAFKKSNLSSTFRYKNKNVYKQSFMNIDWVLLCTYQDKRINIDMIFIYFILPFISLTILAVFLSKILTNKLYRPMREVLEDYFVEGANQKDVDEFKLLKQNSNMIKSLNQKLKAAMNERNNLLVQRLDRELLFGIKINQSAYKDYMLKDANYCVAVLEFLNNPYEDVNDKIFIYKNEIIAYTQTIERLRYVNINYYTCAIIIQCEQITDAKTMIYKLMEAVDIDDNNDIRVAISDVAYGVSNIKKCYDESRKILEYKFLYNQKIILTMDQIKDLNRTTYYYPLMIENKLIHSVLNGDTKAVDIFDELIKENDAPQALSPKAFKNLVFSIIGTIGRILQELKIDSHQFLTDNEDFSSLSDEWNDKDIIPKLRKILENILLHVSNNKKNDENCIAEEMLAYIHENYSKDIMLIDMAEKMSISEKYCGILFKKMVGENYKTYLNRYRIEKAKEKLYSNSDVKVSTLANLVGFNSANTFIRVFTKYTGMTPKTFAERIKNDKNV